MTRLPRSGLICAPPGRPLSKPAAIQVITLRSARKNSEILKSTANVHSNLKKKACAANVFGQDFLSKS